MVAENHLHISGGSVSGPIAIGTNATASVNHVNTPTHVAAIHLLDRLEELIAAHSAKIKDPADAARDTAEIRQELTTPTPNRTQVGNALRRLSVRAAEVTAVMTVIDQIRELLP